MTDTDISAGPEFSRQEGNLASSHRGVEASAWQYVRVCDPSDKASAPIYTALPDGTYEVLVLDIVINDPAVGDNSAKQSDSSHPADFDFVDGPNHEDARDDSSIEGSVAIEVVITVGPQKGAVCAVGLSAAVTERDALEALGLPGVLVVQDGQPHLEIEKPESPGTIEVDSKR